VPQRRLSNIQHVADCAIADSLGRLVSKAEVASKKVQKRSDRDQSRPNALGERKAGP
jgi:hypothetical protein